MSRPKSLALVLMLTVSCGTQKVRGQTIAAATNLPPIRAELRPGETVGTEQVKRAYITSGTNLFVFRVPPGLNLNASDPKKILVGNPTAGRFISIRWILAEKEGERISAERCRTTAVADFPEAVVENQFSQFALNRSCPATDLRWKIGGYAQCARVIFIPLSNGVIEVALVAKTDQFSAGKTELSIMLGSLLSDEGGEQIRIEPLPDFS